MVFKFVMETNELNELIWPLVTSWSEVHFVPLREAMLWCVRQSDFVPNVPLVLLVCLSLGVPHQRHILRLHFPCHLQEIQQILWSTGMSHQQISKYCCCNFSSKPVECVLKMAWVCPLYIVFCEVNLTFWSSLSVQLLEGGMLSEWSHLRLQEPAWKKGNGGNPVSRCRKKTWPQLLCRIQHGAKLFLRSFLKRDPVASSEISGVPQTDSSLYLNQRGVNCF